VKSNLNGMTGRLDGFADLISDVHARSPLVHSKAHGDHHWRLVAWTGYQLLQQLTRVDPLVVLLFGLFHDSQRENEYDDPEHGRRGGELARELLGGPEWGMTSNQRKRW
jgi:HD superfamily phosphodiesterase